MNFSTGRTILLLAAIMLLAACAKTRVMETWQSDTLAPEKPEKIAVLVVWPDQLQRLVVERDMVAMLRDRGVNAVESVEIAGMRSELTPESVEVALRNANADALLVVFIIGGGTSGTFERSDYWLQHVGTGFSGRGWYNPYFGGTYDVYAVREGPGFADQTSDLLLETNYIDVRKLERVWSMVTHSEDTQNQDVASRVTDHIISQMRRANQI